MQMTEDQLYSMTPRTFANMSKGYHRKNEHDYKLQMELHRESIVTALQPHLEKKYRNKTPHQLYPLPWDKPETKTPNQQIDPVAFWENIDKQNWN